MRAEPAELTIVIPTWNRRDLVATCLDSLANQTWRAFKTLVVDDASEDDTVSYLRAHHPEATVIARDRRGGFARATNTGLKCVETPWVLCLNNDITLAPNALETLMRAARAGTDAMLTPLMVWQDTPDVVYAAGDYLRVSGRPESHGFRAARDHFRPPDEVFGVTFGAALLSRAALEDVGLLDEAFGAYFEDVDWCCRARLRGHTARCVSDAVVYHVGSASIRKDLWWRSRQCWQNHLILVMKNFPAALLVRYMGVIARERLHQTRRLWSAARAAHGSLWALRVFMKAHAGLWARLPGAWRGRREIQAGRTVSADQFAAWLEGDQPDG